MADRNKGTFAFAANFEVKLQGLLDPRGGVTTKSELINKETFPYDGNTIYMKEGMLVTVSDTHEVYMLVSLDKILATDYSGWKRVDAGAATPVEVVDNLTTADATKALSANQGKLLKELIDEVTTKVTSIYTPKGSVDSYEELPTENLQIGDVYNVVAAYGNYPAGTNWAWTGDEWDALGGIVDLSNYATIERLLAEKHEVAEDVSRLETSVGNAYEAVNKTATEAKNLATDNKTQLESVTKSVGEINLLLNGNDNDEDDIPNQLGIVGRLEAVEELIGEPTDEDKTTTMLSRLNALEELVTGGDSGEGEGDQTLLQKVNQNTLDITALETTVYGADGKSGLVKAVETLNGADTVVGSVDYKIKQAFTWIDVE